MTKLIVGLAILGTHLKMQSLPQRKHTASLTKNIGLMLFTGIV